MRLSARQSMKLLRSQKAGVLIGSLLLIMGAIAFIHVAKITIDERGARNWVPYTAHIERVELLTHVNDKGGKTYTIDVAYNFEWDGATFKGTRYRPHDKSTPYSDSVEKIIKGLAISKQDGGQYPIFVNPQNPHQSAVLNTAHPKAKSSSLFLGFLFSIMGYFTVFKPRFFGKKSE